ncbi:MAG TPA: hypothetical protein VE954_24185 [Oligoflexus sp.]|uniref:hypothetical protein n=1 Tax=Oligoflexus sp. TaxID=1971216 RepID=UPI002D5EF01A|nr:hypothetical protein [Oligoflexus sp.]HYX36214.1 hypothetical protein [Oligoflexus sp.]
MRRMMPLLVLVLPIFMVACDHKKSKSKPSPNGGFGVTNPLVAVQHVWSTQIAQKNRAPCSIIYDLRRHEDFDFHVLCLSADRQSMNLESYLYAIQSVGSQRQATLIKSTCRNAEARFNFSTSISKDNTDEARTFLSILSGGEYIMLQQMPDDNLLDDLKTATTLHGKPVTRGCFSSPSLDTFVAEESAR